MVSAIEEMDYLNTFDSHAISSSLREYDGGPLPVPPKLSLEEALSACNKHDATLTISKGTEKTVLKVGSSSRTLHYDVSADRFTIDSASPPPARVSEPDELRLISWNCNTWNYDKARAVADLVNSSHSNVILITDARIDLHRSLQAINSFAKLLLNSTGKIWKGSVSPKQDQRHVGGGLIMYSNLVDRP